jgi:nucleotide-binding universal stress UspA family protein
MNPFADKPVLVPVDLSPVSDKALEYAKQIASRPDLITALHVALNFSAVDPPALYVIDEQVRREDLKRIVSKHFEDAAAEGVRTEVRFGDPGNEIAKFATEIGAGLIVMPSHGRTGLAHLLVGSVAERVVRHAHCPVLVLRGLSAAEGQAKSA